jgi:hypothetical protein
VPTSLYLRTVIHYFSVVKRIFGGAVRKTTDAAKSLSAEVTRKRSVSHKEMLPASSSSSNKDMEKLGRLSTDIKVLTLAYLFVCAQLDPTCIFRPTAPASIPASSASRPTRAVPLTSRTFSSRRSSTLLTWGPSGA